jgi:MFS transporter, FHS family, L-fucose permease
VNICHMKREAIYTVPILLVISLFFLWGVAYGLLDVLNKHFQEGLHISKQRSTLLQAAYFGAYFLVALPAGLFISRRGYKKGIITGLLFYAIGAALFYPAAQLLNFSFFLIALFVLASGLTILETAANPYMTVLGPAETSSFRLNLAQSFNGIGSFIGPIIGGLLFFGNKSDSSADMSSVKWVYLIIAFIVLIITIIFIKTSMPEVLEDANVSIIPSSKNESVFKYGHFIWAVVAQFFYVAAQVGVAALFINYCTEKNLGIGNAKASYLLSGGLMLFTLGRFAGTAFMRVLLPQHLLAISALINIILCVGVIYLNGMIAIYFLLGIFFFESIMFPTIFSLGVKGLGTLTKKGSSLIIMSVIGGAIIPYVMGTIAEKYTTAFSYVVPLICFGVVFSFGRYGYKIR